MSLPEDGELRLGPVQLPYGRRVRPEYGQAPVAWVTDSAVRDSGLVWLALSDLAPETGLQPVLLLDPCGLFWRPADMAKLAQADAAALLEGMWYEGFSPFPRPQSPLTPAFPGLASPAASELAATEISEALARFGSARVGLVAASRPADILAVTGWLATDAFQDPLPVAAVLRSWEDRFGASLVQAGPSAELRLLVRRPPRTDEHARAVAAEIWAFADAWIDQTPEGRIDVTTLAEIAPRVRDAPIWGLWWD
jgi:uncharacterized protein DUF4253